MFTKFALGRDNNESKVETVSQCMSKETTEKDWHWHGILQFVEDVGTNTFVSVSSKHGLVIGQAGHTLDTDSI